MRAAPPTQEADEEGATRSFSSYVFSNLSISDSKTREIASQKIPLSKSKEKKAIEQQKEEEKMLQETTASVSLHRLKL
ncbi:unnamed protein product [Phytophthora fragariaefolia]|uniref:Unnamed protein product n=1 Tax=Phytophthora fragariaefolia TaxID=1490495 RepID=A0A9W6XI63_9STRA|nr:unnamed protein product [Phytophthora fragariaefolia]